MTWNAVIPVILPELILISVACLLFLLGVFTSPIARKLAPVLALLALAGVFVLQLLSGNADTLSDTTGSLRVTQFSFYIELISSGIGALFVLLSWPSDKQATGNSALQFGQDAGEYFGLLLLSVAGIFLVAGANDLILLFLGIELASIPTYIMVSVSRPLPVAQEAGVKYFFLGAMAAAVMLFGFSYLYGTTGLTDLHLLSAYFKQQTPLSHATFFTNWQMLAVVMLIGGFAFKMAAVPLHFYAGDVYEGAATPVTALLSYVPKTSGFVALIKILFAVTGGSFYAPDQITKLIWVLAVLTMSLGNLLALVQRNNIKRMLAYSSVAHSGYMLVGVASVLSNSKLDGLEALLFYLAAYGIMNVGAFGVLMLLPSRSNKPATSAETLDDLVGAGRRHLGLGLAMAIACFSLTGLPLTVGFFGKYYLLVAAIKGGNLWLVIITMVNAAVSAGYYLEIVRRMFLSPDPPNYVAPAPVAASRPIFAAVVLSAVGTTVLGIVLPATEILHNQAARAATVDEPAQAVSATQIP